MAEPKIYSENWLNKDCLYSLSHSSAQAPYLYDRDKDSKWISSGANSDATEASIEVTFYRGTEAIDRDVSRVILLNHNLKAPTLEYWNGSAWTAVSSMTPANPQASAHTVFSFTLITTSKFRIRCSTTQITNAEKFIGELIVCKSLLDFAHEFDGPFELKPREKVSEVVLGDGSIRRYRAKIGPNRKTKYGIKGRVFYYTNFETFIEALRTILDTDEPIIFQPESTARPSDVFQGHWASPLTYRYRTTVKGVGYMIDIDFRED